MLGENKTAGQFLLENAEAFEKAAREAFDKWSSHASDEDFYRAFFECKVDGKTGKPRECRDIGFIKAA